MHQFHRGFALCMCVQRMRDVELRYRNSKLYNLRGKVEAKLLANGEKKLRRYDAVSLRPVELEIGKIFLPYRKTRRQRQEGPPTRVSRIGRYPADCGVACLRAATNPPSSGASMYPRLRARVARTLAPLASIFRLILLYMQTVVVRLDRAWSELDHEKSRKGVGLA